MYTLSTVTLLLGGSLFPLAHAQAADLPPNALALLESQPDLTKITKLVKKDPVLVELYSTAKNVTLLIAADSAFPPYLSLDEPPFTDAGLARDTLSNAVAEGIYNSSAFAGEAKYVTTKLNSSTIQNTIFGPTTINTSWNGGVAPLKFYTGPDGKALVRSYTGLDTAIAQSDFEFDGGVLHKLAYLISEQESLLATPANVVDPARNHLVNYALSNATKLGLLNEYDSQKDLTLFTISNEAYEKLASSGQENSGFLDVLRSYIVQPPNLLYGNAWQGQNVSTVSGGTLQLTQSAPNALQVNGINVVNPDVFVQNGVIHVLESPLTS